MAARFCNLSPLFYCSFIFSCFVHLSLVAADNGVSGFTVDLIHRDSPQSPFYNSSHTHFERLRNAVHRSHLRAARFKHILTSNDTFRSPLKADGGEYLMNFSIGTPPVTIVGIVDTGSDHTWTQCKPCTNCYKQNTPIFNPKKSHTYKPLSCKSRICEALDSTCSPDGKLSPKGDICQYSIYYGDGSQSLGNFGVETFTFASTSGEGVSVPNLVFGCGHDNEGIFSESTSGIIGLGGGTPSLAKQLSRKINGKFSYCLASPHVNSSRVTSKISFGSNAIVSGSGVVSTPIFTKLPKTFYYLNLERITVFNKSLPYRSGTTKSKDEGNIVIDSGTTLTYVPQDLYDRFESALVGGIRAKRAKKPPTPFSLCYLTKGDKFDAPKVTFHFTCADLELPVTSTFMKVEEDLMCLAIVPGSSLALFGNISQMNFLIGYDLVNKTISFKPTDCTKV